MAKNKKCLSVRNKSNRHTGSNVQDDTPEEGGGVCSRTFYPRKVRMSIKHNPSNKDIARPRSPFMRLRSIRTRRSTRVRNIRVEEEHEHHPPHHTTNNRHRCQAGGGGERRAGYDGERRPQLRTVSSRGAVRKIIRAVLFSDFLLVVFLVRDLLPTCVPPMGRASHPQAPKGAAGAGT